MMNDLTERQVTPFEPRLPQSAGERLQWGRLYGCGSALAIANAARTYPGLMLVVTLDVQSAGQLERELRFFLGADDLPVINFPDWESYNFV